MHSTLCLNSQLDLFRGPLKQLSHDKTMFVPHYPLTTLSSNGPIEIDIPASPMYTDLSESRLYLKCKVVNHDGSDIAADASVAPVNMLLHACFSKVDFTVNGRLLTQASDTYPWKAALETLINFGRDAKLSQLQSIGYCKDEATGSAGYDKRREWCSESRSFELYGPLHVDIAFQEKYLINGLSMRIKLTRSPNRFCLQSTDQNANYRLDISQAVYYVRRIKVSPAIELAHAKAMEKSNAPYPVHKTEVVVVPIGSGHSNISKEGLFAGRIPRKLVITFLAANSYNGHFAHSPFCFENANVMRIEVTVNGEMVGDTPMVSDFTNNMYTVAYTSLFAAMDKSYADQGTDITYDDFGKKYPLFCFDLTKDSCGNVRSHVEPDQTGTLRLSVQLRENTTETMYMVLYAEFEAVIEVTRSRELLFIQ